jgi:proline racemase
MQIIGSDNFIRILRRALGRWATKLPAREYSVIDTHTAGEPTRIVTDFPLRGETIAEMKEDMQTNHDWFRRFLMEEPRGHNDMFGAILCPAKRQGCDLGAFWIHNGGYLDMCGHGLIGIVTFAVQTGMIEPKEEILVDTSAGVVKAKPHCVDGRVESVSFENIPAFKLRTINITLEGKSVPVDLLFGGDFFAHVEAKRLGAELEPWNKSFLIDLGVRIKKIVSAQEKFIHPDLPHINWLEHVEFSGPPKSQGAHGQNAVVFGRGQMDRSPCGTGTCAKMALLHSEGKMQVGDVFVHESIIGTNFRGRILSETKVGDYDAVVPEITGSAYITGFNKLVFDENDPLIHGFLL